MRITDIPLELCTVGTTFVFESGLGERHVLCNVQVSQDLNPTSGFIPVKVTRVLQGNDVGVDDELLASRGELTYIADEPEQLLDLGEKLLRLALDLIKATVAKDHAEYVTAMATMATNGSSPCDGDADD